jgi:hypothetical protein
MVMLYGAEAGTALRLPLGAGRWTVHGARRLARLRAPVRQRHRSTTPTTGG